MYLNCHSYYSFHYGALSIDQLLETAQSLALNEIVLTDINSTAGCLDFIRKAGSARVKPIVGVDFREGSHCKYIAIAQNNDGFEEINDFLSDILISKSEVPDLPVSFNNSYVIYPFENAPEKKLAENEYIGIRPSQLLKLRFSRWKDQTHKLVILQTGSFRSKRDFNAHRLLRAIGLNTLLSKLPKEEEASPEHTFVTPETLADSFKEFPEIIANTRYILDQCSIYFDFGNYDRSHNKATFCESIAQDREKLRSLCMGNLPYRYPNASPDIHQRLEKELDIIEQKQFFSYFLINWDIVSYARRKGYFYVGRGSGANSMVAYLLRITDVDPIELDLYFERFINPSRKNPPDFDVDFSWRDRDDVTNYIFTQYPKAALLGAHTTFKSRAATRELGKVLGLPSKEIDHLGSRRLNIDQLDEMSRLVIRYSQYIKDFPNHMTVHSSGILIPEKSISCYGSTFKPPKGYPTTHFDMYVAEDVGLHKFDILGQRGLGKIKDALHIVQSNHKNPPEIDIHNVEPFTQDEEIRKLLREGRTLACFYVESPAMRGLLKKLRADSYLGLVAASSIIRPGVAQSGMMQEYIKRFRRPETRKYIHPKLAEILAETYGVMVYQEDVLKVAHFFAGLTLEEADILRRGMSWKFRERNEFWKVRDKFFSNCEERGYKKETAAEVWRQIESFGNFAFAKGHSASYAVESYQSLYFKAYYPLEYLTATINNGGGFYRNEIYIHEARMHGGIIEAPCVNRSHNATHISGRHIFLGFFMMKDFEQKVVENLLRERAENGEFSDLNDFIDRVEISLEQLVILVRIGAFRSIGKDKKGLLWEAHFLLGGAKKSSPVPDMFRTRSKKLKLPPLEHSAHEDALDEIEILGFPLSSPFNLIEVPDEPITQASEFENSVGKEVSILGYLVHVKNLSTREKTARHMQFGTFLDQEGSFIDSVHFPNTANKYSFAGRGCYLLRGKVTSDYDFLSLEVHHMEKIPYTRLQDINK